MNKIEDNIQIGGIKENGCRFCREWVVHSCSVHMKKTNVYSPLLFQQLIAGGTHIVAKAVVTDIDATTLTICGGSLPLLACISSPDFEPAL